MIPAADRRILVVDDDKDALRAVSRALEAEGYVAILATDGKTAIEKIKEAQPDLVLLDVQMPGLSGIDTLKYLRGRKEYVATMFLSAKSQVDEVVHGLDCGADDYIRKPYNLKELLARIRSQLRIKDLNDQLRVANQQLKGLVDRDDLTGLFNMRSLYQKLDHELERGKRFGHSLAVIMMDMDHFKLVNDNHDHLFGSYVLSEVGKIIKDNIRSVDFAARYGGDEFLIVLTESNREGAVRFCERLNELVREENFVSGADEIKLTASMGIAMSDPELEVDSRAMVRAADHALYQAKREGRDRVIEFKPSLDFQLGLPRSNMAAELMRRDKEKK